MKLQAIFVHNDLDARIRFRQLSEAAGLFQDLRLASTFGEGLERLRGGTPWGAFYFGGRQSSSQVKDLVETIRSTRTGKTCACLFHIQDQSSPAFFRETALAGVDGFLATEFTSEDLSESARVASAAHERRSKNALEHDIGAWLERSSESITDAWLRAKAGLPYERELTDAMREAPHAKIVSPEQSEMYFERLVTFFSAIKAPPRSVQPEHGFKPTPNRMTRIVRHR